VRRSLHAPRRSLIAALIAALPLSGWLPAANAQTSSADSPTSQPTGTAAGESKPRWQIAPVRWNGQIGLTASLNESEGQARRTQFSEVFDIGASSYIWQPWFIQVMGAAGLLLSQTREGSEPGGAQGNQGALGGGSRGLTGNFALNVFPVSRFPFQFKVDVNDSRASGDFVGSEYRSTRIGLQQNYRTPRGDSSYVARLDSSTLTSDSYGRDRVNVLEGQMSSAWDNQRLQVDASYTNNSRSSDDLGSRTARLSAQHGWRADELLSVESLGSLSHESRRFAAGVSEFSSEVRQVNTLLNWRTDWDEPVIVFGSARLYESSISNGGAESSGRLANVNGSASYRFTGNLSVFGGASFSRIENGDQANTLTSQSAGAQYQIDPRTWGPATYTANAGVAASNQTGGELGDRRLVQLSAGHRVSVAIATGTASAWNFSLGQDASLINDSDTGASHILSHSGSISWRYSPPAGLAGFASLSIGDSRTYGGEREGEFQLANFQISGQLRPGPYSMFNANFTAQATRQVTALEPEPRVTRSTSGGATYQHVRAFGVPRLRYLAQVNVYNQQTDRRLQGDPNAPREQVSWMFEQRLEYLIGRLDSRLTLRIAEVDGKKNASLIGSVFRRFGR